MKLILTLATIFSLNLLAASPDRAHEYRQFSLKILNSSQFKVFLPGDIEIPFSYNFELANALSESPKVFEYPSVRDPNLKSYVFIDRILFKDGSKFITGKTELPLSCLFIKGFDHREYPSETTPPLYLNVFVVANNADCAGNDESWKTYVQFHVLNFQNFIPENVVLMYRNNKFHAEFVSK